VSKQVDANLVELARKWLNKMMPYRRLDEALISVSSCDTVLPFLLSLLNNGCKPIGITEDDTYIYMRCGSRLTRLHIFFPKVRCPERFEKIVGRVPKLSSSNEQELVDGKLYGHIAFEGSGVYLIVFWDEPVYLGTLKGRPLYLDGVTVGTDYPADEPPKYELKIGVGTKSKKREMELIAEVKYILEKDEIRREIVVWRDEFRELRLDSELGKKLLAMLNEKYTIMDNLLKEVTDIFIKGIVAVGTVLLY